MRKVPFRIRKSSTKFHFKARKPHFKLRKALFKTSLERKGKNKNVLECDVEKDDRFFVCLFNKDYPFVSIQAYFFISQRILSIPHLKVKMPLFYSF